MAVSWWQSYYFLSSHSVAVTRRDCIGRSAYLIAHPVAAALRILPICNQVSTDVEGNVRRSNGPWLDLFGYGADDGRAKNRDVTSTESRELS